MQLSLAGRYSSSVSTAVRAMKETQSADANPSKPHTFLIHHQTPPGRDNLSIMSAQWLGSQVRRRTWDSMVVSLITDCCTAGQLVLGWVTVCEGA